MSGDGINLENARALTFDLWKEATQEAFQSKLKEITVQSKRIELIRQVQEKVLPKYGFEASSAGIAKMMQESKKFEKDEAMSCNQALVEMAFGLTKVWKVVGGGDKGGLLVRKGKDTSSEEETARLSTGALVEQVTLEGARLKYKRRTGIGPDSGWVSIELKGKVLLEPVTLGNAQPAGEQAGPPVEPLAGPRPPVEPLAGPQYSQTPGEPFIFYHQVNFGDTKPTGLRMSACFCAMDEARVDLHSVCDLSAKVLRVTDPHIQFTLELSPTMIDIGKDAGAGGLMYAHPESRGIVTSWLRCELKLAFPRFPMKLEEQNIFFVGKEGPHSVKQKHEHLGTLRTQKAFVNDATGGLCEENEFSGELSRFHAKVIDEHSSEHLKEVKLSSLYPERGTPFVPTVFKKVVWKMSYSFSDCWSRFYHAKVPELLWELNDLAGGPFAKLVEKESDPQAVAVNLPKKMDLGTVFEAYCFLDEPVKSAIYFLYPEGSQKVTELALTIFARYDWTAAPKDGKTLCKEDVDVTTGAGPISFHKYIFDQKVAANKLADLTKLTT